MSILLGIGSYVVAFLVMAIVPNLTQLVFFPLLPLIRRSPSLGPVLSFTTSAIGTLLAIGAFIWIASHTPLRASIAMIVLPAFLSYSNDRQRIQRARAGVSATASMLRSTGDADAHDQPREVRTEYGYLFGDLIGYTIGIFTFVRNEPFF